jgi:phosphoglycolate phosphatase
MALRPTIAFDLDGTLVDTAPDLLDALNLVLREAALGPVAAKDARALVGGGARLMIERGLAQHGVRVADADIDRMLARFLSYYEDHLADRSRPYAGAVETLDALSARKARLIVVTNKFERYSTKVLESLGLARYFSVVAGPDTFGVRKPDPEHLLRAVARAGGDRTATIMVGDSITDVATARAADVPVVAVSYGYRDVAATALGADRIIDRFDEVPAAIDALLAAR